MTLKKRIALIFLFSLGSFACITSMIRLKYIISYGTSADLTYDNVDVVTWSMLEAFMAIVCASLMCLRPLLVKLLPSIFQSIHTKESNPRILSNTGWANAINSNLADTLRIGNNREELHSEDEEGRYDRKKTIQVETSWFRESTEMGLGGIALE
ncbi:hypothetical protein BP6252_06535 [Coleophoma cylindrospora]|uniref:Rhodopsin domain-containing protein n=1 Tax=Coleophoma cylindrospora TaxID=1849047 RepID=A0A3D8RMX3_9HELO|nr:hypothetical protein BP6252_06535 [Coleophoma cylindrospora]